MKIHKLIFIFSSLTSSIAISQQEYDTIPKISLTTVSQENQGNSYITFPLDIGNIEPLWFEGNIIPNFNIRTSKNSKMLGVITPQIILRMYQEDSYPVKTPSYIPQITVYYSLKSEQNVNSFNLFGRFAHHSNGQEGEFYNSDGTINTETGNFSTNFIEAGFIKTGYNKKFNAVKFLSTSFEVHPKHLTYSEMLGIYGLYKLNTILSIFKIPEKPCTKKKANISLKLKTSWTFGNVNNWNSFSNKRLNVSFTFFYHPNFFEDIGFFAQIYHGMDYYNIYFNHQITVIRFGLMTEKLRF